MARVALTPEITLALSVRDRHASAAWYAENLGFTLRFHGDEMGWSEMDTLTPGVVLGLGEQGEPQPGNTTPVFGVTDINTARKALESVGVEFDGDTQTIPDMVSLATFYDPDGNALMFAQDLTKS